MKKEMFIFGIVFCLVLVSFVSAENVVTNPELVDKGITILTPQNGSTIKGDFTFLNVQTNKNAVCKFSLGVIGPYYGGASKPVEIRITGEIYHHQRIENLKETLEGESYKISVTCTDELGNSTEAETTFYVDFSELREMMILKDIGDYEYLEAEISESKEANYYLVEYASSEQNVEVVVFNFTDKNEFKDFFREEIFEDMGDMLLVDKIFDQNIYVLNGSHENMILWVNDNKVIVILYEEEIPLEVVEAYFEKYSSDLFKGLDEFLILDNLGNYSFIAADVDNNNERWWVGFVDTYVDAEIHFGYYVGDSKMTDIMVGEVDSSIFNYVNFLNAFSESFKEIERNGQNIYFAESLGEGIVVWKSGNYVIAMNEKEINWDIIDAYLEKFPSDLRVESDEFLILRVKPVDHNLIESNFIDLGIQTNQISTCFIKLNEGNFEELAYSNDVFHHLDHYILNDGENLVTIKCENSLGEVDEKYLTKNVNLTELRKFMILEDIESYALVRAFTREGGKDENIEYEARYYNKGDENFYTVELFEFIDSNAVQVFLEDEIEEEIWRDIIVHEFNGQHIYLWERERGPVYFWQSNNLFIVFEIYEKPFPSDLIEAYLEKYPSDLVLDTTVPVIELISPEDDYVKRTSKSSKEIVFRFKVSDELEVEACRLIINGKVKETKTNIQKDVENIFAIRLKRGSYDWKIECVDSENNKGRSELRDLMIKKKEPSDVSSETTETPSSTRNVPKIQESEPAVVVLNLKSPEKEKHIFEKMGEWIRDFVEGFVRFIVSKGP